MKLKTKSALLGASTLLFATPIAFTAAGCSNNSSFFTVKNSKGLEIEFCDTGASIYSMKLNGTYLTYHPKDRNTFIDKECTPYYYGKVLGRVAGRFENGKFTLPSGKQCNVTVNEIGNTKNNCLHGGKESLSFKDFKRYIYEDKENKTINVAFNYFSKAGEEGFPESIDAWIVYSLYQEQNRLDTKLFAVPSGETVINLSTHSLFRLGNDGDVLNYQLTIPTDTRVEYNKEAQKATGQVPVGTKSVTLDDGIYDFRNGKTIGKDIQKSVERDPISNGYDHIWTFAKTTAVENRYVNLYNPANKINFKVTATNPNVTGFILYSNDYPRANQIMQDDKVDAIYSGITIEPYTYFTNDTIANITYTPDRPFYNSFSYEITTK